jgi:outer membrane protein assembly factor BamA
MGAFRCALALLALLPATARPQDRDSSLVIRGVEIQRLNVFGPSETRNALTRLANRLHRTTRRGVVERELLFGPGAPYDSARVAETARNLRAVGVFRRVAIDSVRTDSGLIVRVTTADGWTTRPDFRFGSSGSSITYTAALDELNFLGTATQLGIRYRKDPDRSSVIGTFRQPRLLWRTVGLSLAYYRLSDGDIGIGALSKPFFSLSDRTGWSLGGDVRKHRILRFFDGQDVARDSLERRFAMGYVSAARAVRAGPQGYLRVGMNAHIRRDDYAAEARKDTIGKTVTGVVGGFVQWKKARYLVSRGLTSFGREEDVDVSTAISFGVNLTPRGFGYPENGIVPSLSLLTGLGDVSHFVQLYGSGSLRFTSAGLDSGTVQVAATGFLVPAPRHLAVLHGSAGWQRNPAPGSEFDLGLGVGPRAFRAHAFTGDRAFLTSAEYRFTVAEEVLRLSAIGLAGFVDYGGAWWHDSPRRSGWDLGVGLRLGPTRATNVKSTRVDLAYRVKNDAQPGGWVLVVGAGFAFLPSFRLAP